MHVIVCMKQVPDTTQVRIDPETGTMRREGVPAIINPYDVHAVEEAVRVKERYGGTATGISMGPPQAREALQKAISFGLDRVFLITDRILAGSDTLATSYVLSAAIQKVAEQVGPYHLVICGKQTIDGDTAQVGPGIATRLGLAQLSYVEKINRVDTEAGTVEVVRQLEGAREVLEGRLPALLTVVKEINEPRYYSMPALLRGLRAEVILWDGQALGLEREQVGINGSPTVVRRTFAPPVREQGEIIPGGMEDPAAAAQELAEKIVASGVLS